METQNPPSNMNSTGFWARCSKNSDVCITGVVIGALITILLVMIWMWMSAAELFVDPNAMDPQTKELVAYHMSTDPVYSKAFIAAEKRL